MNDKEFVNYLNSLMEINPEDVKMEEDEFDQDFQEWLEGDDEYEIEYIDNDE